MAPIPVALLALVTMLLAGPAREAAAQPSPGKVYRVGLLSQGQPPRAYMEALQNGLKERGYVEGRNLAWERRSTDGSLDQLAQFADRCWPVWAGWQQGRSWGEFSAAPQASLKFRPPLA